MQFLRQQTPKAIDIAIRTLSAEGNFAEMKLFLSFLIAALKNKQDYDLIQATINLFLQVHSELIAQSNDEGMFEKVNELVVLQDETWGKMENLVQNSLCLVRYLNRLPI